MIPVGSCKLMRLAGGWGLVGVSIRIALQLSSRLLIQHRYYCIIQKIERAEGSARHPTSSKQSSAPKAARDTQPSSSKQSSAPKAAGDTQPRPMSQYLLTNLRIKIKLYRKNYLQSAFNKNWLANCAVHCANLTKC